MDFNTVVEFLEGAGIAIGIGIIGYFVSVYVGRGSKNFLLRFMSPTWAGFLSGLVRIALIVLTIEIILTQTGATGAIVVIVTALTGAFAIGSERLAADLVSGVNLLFLDYYKQDDWVMIAGHEGKVSEVSLTHTILLTENRDRVIIPNSHAIDEIIVNHSQIPGHYIEAQIPVSGEHDREKAIQVMEQAALAFPARMAETEPEILLTGFSILVSFYLVRVLVLEGEALNKKTRAKLLLDITMALESAGFTVDGK